MATRKFAGHVHGADSAYDLVIDSTGDVPVCRALSQKGWEALQKHVPPFALNPDKSFEVIPGMENDLRKRAESEGLRVQMIAASQSKAA